MKLPQLQVKPTGFIMCFALVAMLGACAQSPKTDITYDETGKAIIQNREMADPIEPVNRAIFGLNNVLDFILIEPVAKIYTAVIPPFMRNGVHNFMQNLQSPLIVANNLLQGDVRGAGIATARFVINTTAGVGGLIDAADDQGMAYEDEDFGQTLAVWGFSDGFYLVLPVLGPSSLRDTTGLVADAMADPLRIYAHNKDRMWLYYTRNAVEGLDNRARMVKAIADLRRNSLDYYASVRSAYSQKRLKLIQDEKPSALGELPSYDD